MEQYTAELLRFQYVISDLARFCRAILGVGTTDKHFSGVCRPNFTKLGEGIDHFYTRILFHRSDILLRFQTRAAQS